MIWQKYNIDEKLAMLQAIAGRHDIIEQAVEKDWWVTVVLKALSNTSWGNGVLLFKGGTSLSKGWNLIERFSEDIDLAVDRSFFKKEDGTIRPDNTPQQRTILRRKTYHYIKDTLQNEIDGQLQTLGATGYEIVFNSNNSSDLVTEVNIKYDSVFDTIIEGISPQIKMEFSCMSMKDPYRAIPLNSLISQKFSPIDQELNCDFPTVVPERTFLEKIFLLNEEFQRNNPRHERMSRHLYDIEKIINTPFSLKALADTDLYKEIVLHRKEFYNLDGVDYNNHSPQMIDFCPPESQIAKWKSDYIILQKTFIHGDSMEFDELIDKLKTYIKEHIRPLEISLSIPN